MDKKGYRDDFRSRTRDQLSAKYLWPDEEVDSFIYQARYQTAIRSKCIPLDPLDATPGNPAVISMAVGVSDYQMSSKVFKVRWIEIEGQAEPLEESTPEDFLYEGLRLRGNVNNSISKYYIDENGVIHLDGVASAIPGKLLLVGWKTPDDLILDNDVDSEITSHDKQKKLIYHAMSLAYEKQDSEAEHIQKAQYFAGRFREEIGEPVTAEQLRRKGMARRRVVKNGWF